MRKRVLLILTGILFIVYNSYPQWKFQDTTYNTLNLNSVKVLTSKIGWVAGDNGTILSYNGTIWSKQYSGTKAKIKNLCFISPVLGWAMADSNIVLQYYSGNWTRLTKLQSINNLQSLSFVDINHGWAVGILGTIFKYNGDKWVSQSSGTNISLTSVFFTDTLNGWAVGEKGTILKYNGIKWLKQTNSDTLNLYSVYFTDTKHGWAVGDNGIILRYNGVSWQKESSGINYWLRAVCFSDTLHGWAAGEKGVILKFDGKTWAIQKSPTSNMLLSISSIDSLHGWIAGENGRILYTENGGLEGIQQLTMSNEQLTMNIFPNPVIESLVISYRLPDNLPVTLKIFDNLGREIETLINENQVKGEHKLNYYTLHLPDGIYLCRLSRGNNILTKKILKLH
jgi:photosystem II stability/assembly factor-like uncharacterized protein